MYVLISADRRLIVFFPTVHRVTVGRTMYRDRPVGRVLRRCALAAWLMAGAFDHCAVCTDLSTVQLKSTSIVLSRGRTKTPCLDRSCG